MTDWNHLVRDHAALVFGTAWRILGHAADTEDVVQDVFLEAHRLHRTHGVRHWPGLLRRLATCRALDRLRQRRPTVPLDGLALPAPTDGPEEANIERELADRLRQAITRLPDREGEVFCLRYFDDLSNDQIARLLDLSAGAVANALYKARTRLEVLLHGRSGGELSCETTSITPRIPPAPRT